MGNQINQSDKGSLKRHGIHIAGVQGQFAGGFGLFVS